MSVAMASLAIAVILMRGRDGLDIDEEEYPSRRCLPRSRLEFMANPLPIAIRVASERVC